MGGETEVSDWKQFFRTWPAEMPPRGIVVTSWNEQIPFEGFLTNEAFLLVCRQTPDTLGSRMLVLPFEQLAGVKLTEVVRAKVFQSLGFTGTLPTR
jgi:hypothetical protein